MNIEEVRLYILSLPGVTEDQPFGDDIITYRVEGKIFVSLWLGGGRYDMKDYRPRFACKLPPARNEELRDQYEAVQPAFHWNKRHWSDVYYEQLEPELVKEWIEELFRNDYLTLEYFDSIQCMITSTTYSCSSLVKALPLGI